ncbi:MAG: restriction modification system specificity domain protein, partial [Solirubrobacterales bacterium]|nr:restriction modification system specificity domain protein [Solirubrobacterales bacterium]
PQSELRPLSRLVTLQRGVDLPFDDRREGPYPVVTTGGIVGTHDRSIAAGPGVIIRRYGSASKSAANQNVYWLESDYWPHNTTLYVKDFKGNRAKYIYYLLRTYPYDRLHARSAIPGVNRNDMKGDAMPWMPPEQQDACVAHCDTLVSETRRASRFLTQAIELLTERRVDLITAAVTGQFDVTTARAVA